MLERALIFVTSLLLAIGVAIPAQKARGADAISVAPSGDKRVEVFFAAEQPGGGVYHAYQQTYNAGEPSNLGVWSIWRRFDSFADSNSGIVSARDSGGRLVVGWISQGSIWVSRQLAPDGSFADPVRIETHDLHGLTIATNKDGRLEFFALSSAGSAWTIYETAPGALTFASTLIGGENLQALAPAPLQNVDGRLNVAVVGGDGKFYERSQDRVGERGLGGWSEWRYRADGPFIGPVQLTMNQDGRLEAILRRADRTPVHLWQKTPNGSWADEVASFGLSAKTGFGSTLLADGRIAVVAFNVSNATAAQTHGETSFASVSQERPDSSWRLSTAPPTLFAPPPTPPSIAITSFKADPDYVNQGSSSNLRWSVAPKGGCTPSDLMLFEKVCGQSETMILQQPSPENIGSKAVIPPPISSPVRYRLSVSCRNVGATVSQETTLAFAPVAQMAANVLPYGPFLNPSPPREKKPFTVSWTFTNVGNAESAEIPVDLYVDGTKIGDTKTVAKLGSGKSSTFSWQETRELVGFTHSAEIRSGNASLDYSQFNMDP